MLDALALLVLVDWALVGGAGLAMDCDPGGLEFMLGRGEEEGEGEDWDKENGCWGAAC